MSDDDASSVADIPPRKNTKGKGKAVKEEVVEDEEEEDLEADEYVDVYGKEEWNECALIYVHCSDMLSKRSRLTDLSPT